MKNVNVAATMIATWIISLSRCLELANRTSICRCLRLRDILRDTLCNCHTSSKKGRIPFGLGMQISLSKISDVPLHQQLAEQIVFLITTGKLRPAEQLPSVRALATYLRIHHNTVSKSYQDLVQRGWINRHRGSRMCVGTYPPVKPPSSGITLDELLDQSIQRASQLGYSLQELRERVMQRLSAQPPDHVLVVENEPELRRIICEELLSHLGRPVKGCTIEDLAKSQEVAVGALIVSPDHLIRSLTAMLPSNHQSLGLTFADALEQV